MHRLDKPVVILALILGSTLVAVSGIRPPAGAQAPELEHRILASIELPPAACCLVVDRGLAVVGYPDHLQLLDLRDPSRPRQLDAIALDPGSPYSSMTLDRGRLYLATRERGLQIYELAVDAPARLLGALPGRLGEASAMDARDGRLAATVGSDLYSIDVSQPEDPREQDRLGLLKSSSDVEITDRGIAVLSPEAGLILVDAANPSDLRLRAFYSRLLGQVTDLDVSGALAVVSSFEIGSFGSAVAGQRPAPHAGMPPLPITSRIDVVDIGDLDDPRLIDEFEVGLTSSQGYRYVGIDADWIHSAGPVYVPGGSVWALDSYGQAADAEGSLDFVARLYRGVLFDDDGRPAGRSLAELTVDQGRIYALEQLQGEEPGSMLLVATAPLHLAHRLWLPSIGSGTIR